jgi:hypothetical protein
MMEMINKRQRRNVLIVTLLVMSSACSVLPEDIRATLPETMRGDTKALTDYPTPNLSGKWLDKDYPELIITMQQNGSSYTFTRKGLYRGIPVNETHKGEMTGRSVKATYQALYAGEVRPVNGQCFGVVGKDSSTLALTCEDTKKGTYPLNLGKS